MLAECTLDYRLAGRGLSRMEPRGYYVTVVLMERGNGPAFREAFSAVRYCVLCVPRHSKKRLQKTEAMYEQMRDQLLRYLADNAQGWLGVVMSCPGAG